MGCKTEITCDTCGGDLTYTSNCVDYRLVVSSECKASLGGFVTSMMKYPPVDRTYYFCGFICMDKWRDRERLIGKMRSEWSDAWMHEHGTNHGGMWSYPSPPEEMQNERDANFIKIALERFP